jgi:hypothetical protein
MIASSNQLHAECVARSVNAITKRMESDLKSYTDRKEIFGERDKNGGEYLASIVRSAMDFDCLIYQQKAKFVFDRELGASHNRMKSTRFDPILMHGDYTEPQIEVLVQKKPFVKLLCAPALIKYGTSAGENYEKGSLISRAEVDCLVTWAEARR